MDGWKGQTEEVITIYLWIQFGRGIKTKTIRSLSLGQLLKYTEGVSEHETFFTICVLVEVSFHLTF